MTRLEVRHVTTYRYARPVAFGPHRAMLRPRDSHDLKLRSATLAVSPPAEVRWVYDVFGNSITLLEFTQPAAELRVESRIELEQFALDQPDYPIAPGAERWPFAYGAEDRLDLGPALNRHYPDEEGRVRGWAMDLLGGGREMGTLELLTKLTHGIKERLTYSLGPDAGSQEPLETLRKGSGSCRDYALLMMEAARSLGFAARFVTGYLYDPAIDGGPSVQGAGATHAWVQVYLPGAGWIELDPTNGIVGGRNLIRVGVVRDPKQAVPLSGTFTGAATDHLGMEVEVTVRRIDGDGGGSTATPAAAA
jgi:transglutaminase-like putative cysteine protease